MKINTICQYCSAGCSLDLEVKEGKETQLSGQAGIVNTDRFICNRAIKGYQHFTHPNRLTQPLLRTKTGFHKISFDEAFVLIENHIKEVKPDENAFFAGARLSNEELYLVQKIARAAVGTNNLASFHYLGRGEGYLYNTKANIPVTEILSTQLVYVIGDSLPEASPFTWQLIQQAKREQNVKIVWITPTGTGMISELADEQIKMHSIFSFLKLVNRHLIESLQADSFFTDEICLDFAAYKVNLLAENKELHLQNADVTHSAIENFVTTILSSGKEAFVFAEQELSGNACREVHHLAMLTGKMGRVADGIIAIKESVNAQGLIDMGIHPEYGMGGVKIDDEDFFAKAQTVWGIEKLPEKGKADFDTLINSRPKNIFIFGEDPVGEAEKNKNLIASYISDAEFSVVQDFYMTPTAQLAKLVMPSTYLFESGGTYTNTQKIIQQVRTQKQAYVEMDGFGQLAAIAARLGLAEMNAPSEAMFESIMLFPSACTHKRPRFIYAKNDNNNRVFKNGAICCMG